MNTFRETMMHRASQIAFGAQPEIDLSRVDRDRDLVEYLNSRYLEGLLKHVNKYVGKDLEAKGFRAGFRGGHKTLSRLLVELDKDEIAAISLTSIIALVLVLSNDQLGQGENDRILKATLDTAIDSKVSSCLTRILEDRRSLLQQAEEPWRETRPKTLLRLQRRVDKLEEIIGKKEDHPGVGHFWMQCMFQAIGQDLARSKEQAEALAQVLRGEEPTTSVSKFVPLFLYDISTTKSNPGVLIYLNPQLVPEIVSSNLARILSSLGTPIYTGTAPKPYELVDGSMPVGGFWDEHRPLTIIGSQNKPMHNSDDVTADSKVGQRTVDFVNRIQSVPYSINKWVLDIGQKVYSHNLGWVKGDSGFEMLVVQMPEKPEKFQALRDEYRETRDQALRVQIDSYYESVKNSKRDTARLLGYAMTLSQAEDLKNEERIFFPGNLDFRSRFYYQSQSLSPQGSTFEKGCLQFADAKPLGNKGVSALRRFIGSFVTDAGDLSDVDISKGSIEEQMAWTESNLDVLRQIVQDPMGTLELWERTDSPFEFISAAKDYVEAMDSGDPENHESHVIVRTDATCSGLQHCASLLRDEKVGRAVNLIGETRATDVYTLVSEAANALLDRYEKDPEQFKKDVEKEDNEYDVAAMVRTLRELSPSGFKRKHLKPICMQSVYGVGLSTIGQRLAEMMGEAQVEKAAARQGVRPGQFAYWMAMVQWHALSTYSETLMPLLDFFKSVARKCVEHGKAYVWTNPVGFTMVQSYPNTKSIAVDLPFYKTRLRRVVAGQRKIKMANAATANTIHSLDASLLVLLTERFEQTISMIHDSVGTHACDVWDMNEAVKAAHVELYSTDILADLVKQQNDRGIYGFDELPEKGSLKIEDVQNSGYYFS